MSVDNLAQVSFINKEFQLFRDEIFLTSVERLFFSFGPVYRRVFFLKVMEVKGKDEVSLS